MFRASIRANRRWLASSLAMGSIATTVGLFALSSGATSSRAFEAGLVGTSGLFAVDNVSLYYVQLGPRVQRVVARSLETGGERTVARFAVEPTSIDGLVARNGVVAIAVSDASERGLRQRVLMTNGEAIETVKTVRSRGECGEALSLAGVRADGGVIVGRVSRSCAVPPSRHRLEVLELGRASSRRLYEQRLASREAASLLLEPTLQLSTGGRVMALALSDSRGRIVRLDTRRVRLLNRSRSVTSVEVNDAGAALVGSTERGSKERFDLESAGTGADRITAGQASSIAEARLCGKSIAILARMTSGRLRLLQRAALPDATTTIVAEPTARPDEEVRLFCAEDGVVLIYRKTDEGTDAGAARVEALRLR